MMQCLQPEDSKKGSDLLLRFLGMVCLVWSLVSADESDEFLDGFEEEDTAALYEDVTPQNNQSSLLQKYGIEGYLKQEIAYGYKNKPPHDTINSLRSSLFLEYNDKFFDDYKVKINTLSFYDFSYLLKGKEKFTSEELSSLEYEIELYDAYIEGSLSKTLDFRVGRQVVVWGKSDTIRVVDVLNPLDNRRPGMVDIENLRLDLAMAKFDYYFNDTYKITPIIIFEQREDKLPPYGGDFNPSPVKTPLAKKPKELTYALHVAGEFSSLDAGLYLASYYPSFEFYPQIGVDVTQKVDMYGADFNYVHGSFLFKAELAYKHNMGYLDANGSKFLLNRVDALAGVEYKGIADTTLSLDVADKRFVSGEDTKEHLQTALRITSDFQNATLHVNYLVAVYGNRFDKGGYQRGWIVYDISDSLKTTLGFVDYLKGNPFFTLIDDNDMIFTNLTYSF